MSKKINRCRALSRMTKQADTHMRKLDTRAVDRQFHRNSACLQNEQ